MNAAKQCKDRFDDIVALVMGELDPVAARELQDHIALCDRCGETRDVLVEEEKEVRSGFEALARSLGPVKQTLLDRWRCHSQVRVEVSNNHFLESVKEMILVHKRLSVTAVATVTALAASLILYVSLVSSPTAYALEQTVQANEHVMSYHAKITPAAELGEVWVQLNTDGTPLRARWDLQSPDDGAKVVVFSEGKAEIWFKDKKAHVFVPEKDGLKMVMKERSIFDPKLAFEELQASKANGKAQVETKEPSKEGDPITLTVTSKDTPDRREMYEVDPTTKLVKRVTHYRRQGDRWEQVSLVEYLDYNQEIDPTIFQLELPKDIVTIDQIHQKSGLAKGSLTDDEIATKVVQEFFEALIAEDYKKAGMILSGVPAERIKEAFGRTKFLRIVEIGKPTPAPNPKMKAIQVPVKVECEIEGKKEVRSFSPFVRALYNQPDFWEIIGGI